MSLLELPPYEIINPVGRGGMGAVFLATDSRTGGQLAVKILRPEIGQFNDLHARFRRETRAVSALDHPNIVKVLEVGELTVPMAALHQLGLDIPEEHRPTEYGAFNQPPEPRELEHTDDLVELPFIAMEWLPGRDLGELIADKPSLVEALEIGGQILDALIAAHERGIVHRDLKPANIRVTPDGVVKLLDFGLAKLLPGGHDLDTTSHLTLEGTVMGTLPYLAPEQLRGERVGPGADLFAFGVLLYELLAGEPPYPGESMVAYARALLTGLPPHLQEEVPEAPDWLDQLVSRLITVDLDDRPRTAAEVRSALDRGLRKLRLDQARQPADQRFPTWLMGALMAAVIAAILAAALLLAWPASAMTTLEGDSSSMAQPLDEEAGGDAGRTYCYDSLLS